MPPQARKDLKKLGWAKGIELAKLARRDRQRFDCATWLLKARQMPTEEFVSFRQSCVIAKFVSGG
jgi:hypothetical protein